MERIELEKERQGIIDKEENEDSLEILDEEVLPLELLGDDLERVQLEQALEVTSNIVPRDSLEEILNPRASESEIQTFMDTAKEKFPCSTFEFEPCENPYRDGSYRRHKQHIYQSTKSLGEHGEKLLVHGTDEKCIKPILDDDFSLTNRSTHGNRLGKGIYFTEKLPLACNYSERGNNRKYLILCKVHVGNIMKGDGRGILDKMPNSDQRYDTIVEKLDDNIENTGQFNKVKNNTYSIQGIITVTINDEDSSLLKYYSSKYSMKSTTKSTISSTGGVGLSEAAKYDVWMRKKGWSKDKTGGWVISNKGSAKNKVRVASLTIVNKTHKEIEVYHKPNGIPIYSAQLSDLQKMKNSLKYNGQELSLTTYIGDVFMCSDKTDIIRIIEVADKREIVIIE